MFPSDINLAKMANERTVVENAARTAQWVQADDLGRRYEQYQQQTGNLYATGYALAAENAHGVLRAALVRLRRALGRAPRPASQQPVSRRPGAELTHGRTVAR